EFLGYVDSGRMGEPANTAPYACWSADGDAAARRLAAILSEESADVLTAYDHHGGYGHPDHIQVHRVWLRAAARDGTPVRLQATMNRDHIVAGIDAAREAAAAAREVGAEVTTPLHAPDLDIPDDSGELASNITPELDVSDLVGPKRAAMI